VAYGNGTFVAVGWSGTILTSADGIVWTPIYLGIADTFSGVRFGNGTFVAISYSGTILTSSDGRKWTSRTSGFADALTAVAYGNGTFAASSTSGTILTSSDGITWTIRNSGTYSYLRGVTYGNGTFVTVGSYGTILQSDPVNGTCTATLSEDLSLHVPIIQFSGQPYWAEFQYASNLDLELKDAGLITDTSPFSGCTPSSMSSDYTIHIPFLNYTTLSFWADFQYKEGLMVTLTNAGRN
jgi:hypothetical protein